MKMLFTATMLAIATITFGQDEKVLTQIAKESCPCLTELLKKEFKTIDALNLELGMCMITPSLNYSKELKKLGVNVDKLTSKEGKKLGVMVAPYLLEECEDFQQVIKKVQNFDSEDLDEEAIEEAAEEAESLTMKGVFMSVENNQFAVINFKDEMGKRHNLYWLHYFDGSDLLIDDAKLFEGKSATVFYDEYEFYVPTSKTYNLIKVISGITFE